MLTVEDVAKIVIDFLRGRAPTIKGKEADELRRRLEKDVAEIKAKGYIVDLPEEWPDIGG